MGWGQWGCGSAIGAKRAAMCGAGPRLAETSPGWAGGTQSTGRRPLPASLPPLLAPGLWRLAGRGLGQVPGLWVGVGWTHRQCPCGWHGSPMLLWARDPAWRTPAWGAHAGTAPATMPLLPCSFLQQGQSPPSACPRQHSETCSLGFVRSGSEDRPCKHEGGAIVAPAPKWTCIFLLNGSAVRPFLWAQRLEP